jgi:hypothetical protein
MAVGLTLPDYLAEAKWLTRNRADGDQVLVSLNDRGFVVVIVRPENLLWFGR